MNRQFWLNNLWHGENSRERNRRELSVLLYEGGTAPTLLSAPDNSRLWGTDHSPWDGNVNMNAVKANGATFTFIKCMDGTVASKCWLENRQRALAAGLIVGDYSWLYPHNKVDCKLQAQAAWNRIKGQPKQLPLVIDFEWTKYAGVWANPTYLDLEIFVTEWIRLAGYKPMVYSAPGYMNPMGPMPESLKGKLAGVWFANYGVASPMLPYGFSAWDFWQFACTGDATVISPNDAGKLEVDLNYWRSNLDSLKKLAGISVEVTPPPPPPPVEPAPEPEPESKVWVGTALEDWIRVRSAPSTAVGTFTGSYIQSEEEFTGRLWQGNDWVWMKIVSANGTDLIGKWVAVRKPDLSIRLIKISELGSAQPTEPMAGIPLPAGTMHQVLHDHEANDGKQRYGMPEVWPLYLARYCDLTEEWQRFWFKQLIHSYTGFTHWDEKKLTKAELDWLKGKWAGITKSSEAFTNFKGTDQCHDFIRGMNTSAELPGQEPLTCCGNIVKVMGGPVRMGGKTLIKIETLDGNKPPPAIEKINRLTAPHVIFCATNVSRIIFPDGKRRIDPFPQLAPHDVLVPLRTNGKEAETYVRDGVNYATNYILASRLKALPKGSTMVPRPYYP